MDIVVYSGPRHSGEVAQEVLKGKFDVRIVEPSPESLLPEFEKCVAFLDASMKVPIDKEAIDKAKDLKLIVTATTGASHIDQAALQEKEIPLLTLKGQRQVLNELTPAAELSWMLLMACARKARQAFHHVEAGQWDRTSFPGIMLKGKTLGVIGIGRLGSWMARYATAFDMHVQAYDPFVENFPEGVEQVELDTLVATSDFISLHVHLSEETRGMLSAEIIQKFKKGSVFINTSRGELTDEAALIEALEKGDIAAAGVDVLANEANLQNNPLWQYARDNSNVIITPHIGGFCPDAVDRVVRFSAQRILDYFANKG